MLVRLVGRDILNQSILKISSSGQRMYPEMKIQQALANFPIQPPMKNTSRTLNGSAVYLYWAILPIPTKVCSHQEMPSISGHQALVGLALISAKDILLHRFRISFHLLRPHLLPRHLMVQAQRQLQLPVKLYFDFRFSSKFEKQDQRTDYL